MEIRRVAVTFAGEPLVSWVCSREGKFFYQCISIHTMIENYRAFW